MEQTLQSRNASAVNSPLELRHKRFFGINFAKFIGAQVIYGIILLIAVTLIAFFLLRITSLDYYLSDSNALDVAGEYAAWLTGAVTQGDFGLTDSGESVMDVLAYPTFRTLLLTTISLLLSFIFSFIIGWIWAHYSNNILISGGTRLIYTVSSIPLFLAAFLISFFTRYFLIEPDNPANSLEQTLIYWSIPFLTLAIFDGILSELISFVKGQIDNVRKAPFISTLTMRGGKKSIHILKHIAFDLIAILQSKFIHLIGGAIVVEIIFNWIGIGLLGFEAVRERDDKLFLGVLVLTTLAIVLFQTLVKAVNFTINPIERRKMQNLKKSFLDFIKA